MQGEKRGEIEAYTIPVVPDNASAVKDKEKPKSYDLGKGIGAFVGGHLKEKKSRRGKKRGYLGELWEATSSNKRDYV